MTKATKPIDYVNTNMSFRNQTRNYLQMTPLSGRMSLHSSAPARKTHLITAAKTSLMVLRALPAPMSKTPRPSRAKVAHHNHVCKGTTSNYFW